MAAKAKESLQIQKARDKLKKQLADSDKRINAEALKEMTLLIQNRIQRHKSERIDLKTKQVTHFSLFDENQHPAKTESKFVHRLLDNLQNTPKTKRKNNLEGRIKSVN